MHACQFGYSENTDQLGPGRKHRQIVVFGQLDHLFRGRHNTTIHTVPIGVPTDIVSGVIYVTHKVRRRTHVPHPVIGTKVLLDLVTVEVEDHIRKWGAYEVKILLQKLV
ncbi:hypothetical protein D3C87_1510610 [compost metagenome]